MSPTIGGLEISLQFLSSLRCFYGLQVVHLGMVASGILSRWLVFTPTLPICLYEHRLAVKQDQKWELYGQCLRDSPRAYSECHQSEILLYSKHLEEWSLKSQQYRNVGFLCSSAP